MAVAYLEGFLADIGCLVLRAVLRGQYMVLLKHYADLHLVYLSTRVSRALGRGIEWITYSIAKKRNLVA
jgi:hypothetical protein